MLAPTLAEIKEKETISHSKKRKKKKYIHVSINKT